MTTIFIECDACRKKPGSPGLCSGCLTNRATIERLGAALAKIRYAGNDSHPTAIWMQKVAAHAMQPMWPDPGEQPTQQQSASPAVGAGEAVTSKQRVTLTSKRHGEFDLDELVDRLSHSHAPKPRDEDLYNAQFAILHLINLMRREGETPAPIPMILQCPMCSVFHIDEPNEAKGWTNPPHRSHECQFCGCIWRPADVPTTGVKRTETRGKADTWPRVLDVKTSGGTGT